MLLLGAALALGTGQIAFAQASNGQDPEPEASPSQLDDVIVEGGLLERAQTFVESVSRPPQGRGLARWMGPVCIGVVNFKRQVAERIADGLLFHGEEFGVPMASDACEPNIFIVGAVNATAVAADWVERQRRDFRPACVTRATPPMSALDAFVTSDAAVRWWQISIPSYFDIFLGRAAPICGEQALPIFVYSRSQLAARTRDDLQRVVIIVDVEKLGGVTLEQLQAFLTLVAFAQINPDADTSEFDTILNLFSGGSAPPGLTEWDRAYLRAMYSARSDTRLNPGDQARGLVSTLGDLESSEP